MGCLVGPLWRAHTNTNKIPHKWFRVQVQWSQDILFLFCPQATVVLLKLWKVTLMDLSLRAHRCADLGAFVVKWRVLEVQTVVEGAQCFSQYGPLFCPMWSRQSVTGRPSGWRLQSWDCDVSISSGPGDFHWLSGWNCLTSLRINSFEVYLYPIKRSELMIRLSN